MYAFNVVPDPNAEYDHALHHQSSRTYRNDYGTASRYLKCEASPPITPPRVTSNIRTATPHHVYHSSSSIQNQYRMNTNPTRSNQHHMDDTQRHY